MTKASESHSDEDQKSVGKTSSVPTAHEPDPATHRNVNPSAQAPLNRPSSARSKSDQYFDVRLERSIISYEPDSLFPARVRYPDGTLAQFAYDDHGKLTSLVNRYGQHFQRQSNDTFILMGSGLDSPVSIEVLSEGTIWFRDYETHIEQVTGTKLLAVAFSKDLDYEQVFKQSFKHIDRNADGGLSKLELEKAKQLFSQDPKCMELLSVLTDYFEAIIEAREDPMLIASGGLELEDLHRFERKQGSMRKRFTDLTDHVLSVLNGIFARIDSSNEGAISLRQIYSCEQLPDLSPNQIRTMRTIARLIELEPAEHSQERFSPEEFRALCEQAYRHWIQWLIPTGAWFMSLPAGREV